MSFRPQFLTNARLPERIRRRVSLPVAAEHGCPRAMQVRSSEFHRFARELSLRA